MSEPLMLAIDASTYSGTAALIRGDALVAERTVAMRGEREERLMPAIHDLFVESGLGVGDLNGVICGEGPGSFTSLRIAASIAKGLAAAAAKPLFAVPSLLLIVAGAEPGPAPGRYAVFLDAMRGELYAATAEVGGDGRAELASSHSIIPSAAAQDYASAVGATPIGPAIGQGSFPHARGVRRVSRGGPGRTAIRQVDLDSWEPDYGRLAEAQVRWEAEHGRALPRG